jgi:hypothetical protein
MRRSARRLFLCVALPAWLCLATIGYGLLWSRYPEYFPTYPHWVEHLIDLTTDGTMDDFVFKYILLLSFANVVLITLAGWLAWRWRPPRFRRNRHRDR